MTSVTTTRLDPRELVVALRQVGSIVLFGVAPVLVVGLVLSYTYSSGFLYDFHGDLYNAGVAILHGHDPYRVAFLNRLAAMESAGGRAPTTFAVPVYPAPVLLASVPLALVSLHVAGVLFTLLSIAAMALGLRLLGVRDWRCYGVAFLSWPVVHSLRLGQVNELLLLGSAVAWRFRARLWPPAIAVASVVAVKLFLWPLGVWLLVTRRWRVAVLAVALGTLAALAAWAVIGFDGLGSYPKMLSDLSTVEGEAGVSLVSLGHAIGVPRSLSTVVQWLATFGLLGLAWRIALRPGGDRTALGLAVLAGLICSPLVWPHYLTLVFIPIALLSPTLSPLWFVPLLGYLAPVELTGGDLRRILPYTAVELVVLASLWARRSTT